MITPHLYPIQSKPGATPTHVTPVHAVVPPTPLQIGEVYKQILLSAPDTDDRFEPGPETTTEEPPRFPPRRSWRTVADIMKREVLSVRTTTTVGELAQFLSHHRISGVPVLDGEDKLVGVVSLSDVNAYAAHAWARIPPPDQRPAEAFYQNSALLTALESMDAGVQVGKIMSPYVYFATSDSDLLELADLMIEQHIHRLLVLEEDQMVGIVTSLDVMQAMRKELALGVP